MGLFDSIMKSVLANAMGSAGSEHQPLLNGLAEMLAGQKSGGLAELVQSFKDQGLGDIVSSWISTGPNLPISPEQIRSALGSERLQALAEKVGASPETVGSQLSNLLPTLVDRLTPDGKLPAIGDLLGEGFGFLKK
jgi:uncharacterized protein YidB (DUF937 family)